MRCGFFFSQSCDRALCWGDIRRCLIFRTEMFIAAELNFLLWLSRSVLVSLPLQGDLPWNVVPSLIALKLLTHAAKKRYRKVGYSFNALLRCYQNFAGPIPDLPLRRKSKYSGFRAALACLRGILNFVLVSVPHAGHQCLRMQQEANP